MFRSKLLLSLFFVLINNGHTLAVDTQQSPLSFDLPELGVVIDYPAGVQMIGPPRRKHADIDMTGSAVAVDFYIQYGDIWLEEIRFHTIDSIKRFEKRGITITRDNRLPESWNTSDEFIRQQKDILESRQNEISDKETFRGRCYRKYPNEIFLYESIAFYNDVRVMIVMGSQKSCEDAGSGFQKLLQDIDIRLVGS